LDNCNYFSVCRWVGRPLTVAWINRLKDMKLAKINAEFDRKKEFDSWLRQERYKASINLIDLIASHYSRTDFDNWPDEIRAAIVRIHSSHFQDRAKFSL
jgi:hypothetical protein